MCCRVNAMSKKSSQVGQSEPCYSEAGLLLLSSAQRTFVTRAVAMGRWAQLEAGPEEPEQDSQVHKMAMNIGRRPSIEDGTDMTVEVHILHTFQSFNFRGKHLRVIGTGYIRSGTSYRSWKEKPHVTGRECARGPCMLAPQFCS